MEKDTENSIQTQIQYRLIEELTVTNQKLQEEVDKALAAAKAKSRFLTNMSHEIRTPMNGIMGLTHLLLSTGLTDKQREYLNAMVTSSDTLSVIVDDILDISKLEAGQLKIESRSFDLKATIANVVEIFSVRATEKGLKLHFEIDNTLPSTIIGDAARLNQILYNLMGNALKFTKEGEVKLVVNAINQDDSDVEIEFSVQDTGIGIVKSKLEYIFQAFEQAKNSTSRKYGGTGLGLTIVKRLVELQGGSISVVSKVGQGSKFNFVLSYAKNKTPHSDTGNKNTESFKPLKGLKLLLVEDNPVNQLVTKDLLLGEGVEVVSVNNGVEAIKSLESAEFDVILMDIQMPVMDGYQAMQYIRTEIDPKKRSVPILALTAHAIDGEMEKCKQAGASDYLSKPFNPQDLFSKIAGLMDKSTQSTSHPGEADLDAGQEVVIDLGVLRDFTGGKVQLMINTIKVLLTELPKNVKIMHDAAVEKDWDKLRAVAHKMKPNMMLIGAETQKVLLQSIERDTKKYVHLDEVPKLVDQVRACIPRIIEQLNEQSKTLNLELAETPNDM